MLGRAEQLSTRGVSHVGSSRRPPDRRWLRPVPVVRRRRPHRALHRDRSRDRDHRLPARLPRPAARRQDRRRRRDPREGRASCTASAARPIGNSRVKLTNAKPTASSAAWSQEGQDPLQVAAEQLKADGVDVLHTIGGDDTNTTAADLAAYLARERLRPDRRRPAQDDRQRRGADQAVARRVDRRRGGRRLRRERHRRAPLGPAHAHRARGHGPALRVADRRRGRRVPQVARHAGVGARASA